MRYRRRRRSNDVTQILFCRRRWTRRSVYAALILIAITVLLDRFGYFKYQGDDWKRFDQKEYLVRHVIDGDTVIVRDPTGNETHVRLLGIDAAELHPDGSSPPEYWAEQATRYLESLVEGKRVIVRLEPTQTRDKYDRLLAYLYLTDSDPINLSLVRDGQVYADRRFAHTFRGQFEAVENLIRKKGVGLWKNVKIEQMPAWRREWLARNSQNHVADFP